jgi:carbon-monoxide dehydrogenase small subunit
MIDIELTVDGKPHRSTLNPAMSLMDFLRDTLDCKGVKVCCSTGECGACNVLLNGVLINSCVTLAATAADGEITTVEGIAQQGSLHPIQEAFIEAGASQCGYCTPGFIVAGKALLDARPDPNMEEIQEYLSGNVCRCTGYTKIIEAIRLAAARIGGGS